MGEEEARARAQAEKQQRAAARRQQEEERETRLRERKERARAIEAENARLREELRAAQQAGSGGDNARPRAPSFGEFDPLAAAGASAPPPSVEQVQGQAGAAVPPTVDYGNFFEGFCQAFTQSLRDVMVATVPVASQPPPPPPPSHSNEPTPRNEHRAVLDVLKQKLCPLKVGAPDMALELESFFSPDRLLR